MLKIDLAESAKDRAAVFVIRGVVFVAEQQVPIDEEWDDHDLTADHLLARLDEVPVGTGRLVTQGERGMLGRLAVLSCMRGTGTGVALVRAIEDRARDRGLTGVDLHAQTHALGFYERLGYHAHGAEFLDAGIPHVHMSKDIVPTPQP
ncbi:GNAT family N-acetyltransferase [Nocardiopsis gilva YIM 90087]|uniref:GNAT family N-acetyltransferase n=1 Tax=Nocardiopsis gilva YIM 90087 TaxID=1235441 RepID=A0A223S5M0_9ACTN|nr:GNAT family N-acetyltransferase [Nocardiopsis gilva]ASU83440.1 GNAT family N-acetyltransferase [Nocardiopsis gilva YIM 90087]